jgi:cytosine/adenosine deaminase-related metal-dependent hydrolase
LNDAESAHSKLDEVSEFVERWQGKANGRITAWLGPHSPYTVSPELLSLTARRTAGNATHHRQWHVASNGRVLEIC